MSAHIRSGLCLRVAIQQGLAGLAMVGMVSNQSSAVWPLVSAYIRRHLPLFGDCLSRFKTNGKHAIAFAVLYNILLF